MVVADDEIVKTHVHTNDPGLAIQKALTYGSLSKIKIDNMREEHQEKLIKDAEKQAAAQKAGEAERKKDEGPKKDMGFVVVSIGEGLNQIFRDLGADALIEGGQTMNPSTEDVLDAVRSVNADTVFVLPNNKNIILAANQAASLTEDKRVIVLPTKTIPQGITALINYIPEQTPEENESRMLQEIANVKTGQVTYASAIPWWTTRTSRKGTIWESATSGILSVNQDMKQCFAQMVDQMVDEDSAIVSVFYGADVSESEAQELADAWRRNTRIWRWNFRRADSRYTIMLCRWSK